MFTRRTFLDQSAKGLAALGATTVLPYAALAAGHSGGDIFETDSGEIVVHPIAHASFIMETPGLVIYADPVGDAAAYAGGPAPDLILITHEHGDHYNAETLAALVGEDTKLVTNPAVYDMLPDDLKARATSIANGESTTVGDITIDAIPAYNTTADRLQYHPQGRDNGYVLSVDGKRVYIAGDTEDIPEMRALTDIDLAFVPMNLPYTMDVTQAADAVAAFAPTYVYPYHYKGSDMDAFASHVKDSGVATEIKSGAWYG